MSLSTKTITSVIFAGSIKLIQRGLGIISMLILARVLTPEDFGIVSICTLAVFLFSSLSDVGAKQYIARVEYIDEKVLNTAWTLNICIKFIIWLVFVSFTSTIAEFLGKPEIEFPLKFLSIILIFGLLSNPGVWLLSRDLNYKPLFKIDVASKLISFSAVLLIVYFEPSYWAMLIGVVLSYLLPCLFSHLICSHKPRLTLVNLKHQLKFSQWVVADSLVGYARGEGDSMLIAKYFDLDIVGIYSMFKNLASMPLTQLISPATEPLLATFSTSIRKNDFQPYQMNIVLLLVLSFAIPLMTLMSYFDYEIVLLFLGENWVEHSYIFSILSFMIIPGVIYKILSQYVLAAGGYKPIVYYQFVMTIVTLTLLFIIIGSDLHQFTAARVFISLLSMVIFCTYVQIRYKLFGLSDILLFLLPIIAASIAIGVIETMNSSLIHWFAKLVLGCTIFSIIYSLILFLLVYLGRKRYECSLFLSYADKAKNFILAKI